MTQTNKHPGPIQNRTPRTHPFRFAWKHIRGIRHRSPFCQNECTVPRSCLSHFPAEEIPKDTGQMTFDTVSRERLLRSFVLNVKPGWSCRWRRNGGSGFAPSFSNRGLRVEVLLSMVRGIFGRVYVTSSPFYPLFAIVKLRCSCFLRTQAKMNPTFASLNVREECIRKKEKKKPRYSHNTGSFVCSKSGRQTVFRHDGNDDDNAWRRSQNGGERELEHTHTQSKRNMNLKRITLRLSSIFLGGFQI